MIWGIFQNVLSTIFLRTSGVGSFYLLVTGTFYLFGMGRIFQKCGAKGWWALIPCLREVKLGEITGWEREGRIAAVLYGASALASSVLIVMREVTV